MATFGLDAVLGYRVGGVGAGGTGDYLEMDNVIDLTFNGSHTEADATSRAAQGWEISEPILKTGELSFDMLWKTADAGFTAFRTAWLGRSLMGMAILDGPLTTGDGFVLDMKVIGFEIQQQLREAVRVSLTLKPADSVDPPEYVTGGVNTPP